MNLSSCIRFLVFVSLVSGGVYAASLQYIEEFPENSDIHAALGTEPLQGDPSLDPFLFDYRDSQYLIEPVHSYEISGLVVSHNNTTGLADIYHDSDSVDFKDLCVVWGDNVDKALLERISFWSEPWTCYMSWKDREVGELFNPDQLSNTHLLTGKTDVRELIQNVKVGDQVQLRGMLVNYADKRYPSFKRNSSVVRTDTGNGACEVMFVESAKVLREGNAFWRFLHWCSRSLLYLFAFLLPVLWITNTQLQFQRMKNDVKKREARMRGQRAIEQAKASRSKA